MLKIEIPSDQVLVKSGTSAKTGRPYSIREQIGYVHLQGKAYPSEFKVSLEDNQQPYGKGVYTLAPDSFYVGKFGELICKPRLVAVQQRAAA